MARNRNFRYHLHSNILFVCYSTRSPRCLNGGGVVATVVWALDLITTPFRNVFAVFTILEWWRCEHGPFVGGYDNICWHCSLRRSTGTCPPKHTLMVDATVVSSIGFPFNSVSYIMSHSMWLRKSPSIPSMICTEYKHRHVSTIS